MRRLTYMIIGLLLVITFPALSAESPFNVDVFFGWDGYYRPTQWTPIEVGISSQLEEHFGGSIILSAQQDGLNTMNVRHDFALTRGIPQHIPMVMKFAFNADNCDAKLINTENGRHVWRQSYNLGRFTNHQRLKPIRENDLLIGLVGSRGFGLIKLPEKTQSSFVSKQNKYLTKGDVYIGDKLPRMAPWDWTGYSSLDLLILYAPNWSLFKTQQLNAICQWVSKGGKLLLIPGSAPITEDNPINTILPYQVNDPLQTTLTAADLSALKLDSSKPETLIARPVFTNFKAPVIKVANSQTGQCFFVSGNEGFGTVGILAIDPSDLSHRQTQNTAPFWVNCITMMLESKPYNHQQQPDSDSAAKKNPRRWRNSEINNLSMNAIRTIEIKSKTSKSSGNFHFQTGLAQSGSNTILEYLYGIDEMKPLGIWPVIFLLILLALLVGPVDYIVLKRKDILPLTWLTSTFWIVLFSFGAYHGVQALRGGDLQMRHVSIIDAISGPRAYNDLSAAWTTNYSAIFAPKNDNYKLLDERDKQWYSAVSPAQIQINPYSSQSSSKQVHYIQQNDGKNIPYSLPINIWTMQCLINESPADQVPIRATCTKNNNEVTVKINNISSADLKKGYILFDNDKYLALPVIPAKSSKQVTGTLIRGKKWDYSIQHLSGNNYTGSENFLDTEKAFSAQGCLTRSRAIKNYLASGAAVIVAKFDNPPVPYKLEDKSCKYKHIQIARLVIFPEQKNKDIAYDKN